MKVLRATRSFDIRFGTVLFLVFMVSFLGPVILGFQLKPNLNTPAPVYERLEVFPHALEITSAGQSLTVHSSEQLHPTIGEDFIIFSWLNFNKLPAEGENVVLLSKYDGGAHKPSGYGVSIKRTDGKIRPLVYWRDLDGKVGVLEFAEPQLYAQTWYMIALSFLKGRYLALHLVQILPSSKLKMQLLGGYDLETSSVPTNNIDIIMGAAGNNGFRGALGPIGILSRAGIAKNLKQILAELVTNPYELPSKFESDNVRFWSTDLERDKSKFNHSIVVASIDNRTRKGRKKK